METGLRPLVRLPASERTGQEFIWLYTGLWDGPIAFDPVEIEAGEYFPSDIVTAWIEARPSDFAPGFVECWKAWLSRTSLTTARFPALRGAFYEKPFGRAKQSCLSSEKLSRWRSS